MQEHPSSRFPFPPARSLSPLPVRASLLALAGLCLMALPVAAQTLGPVTRAEYDLTHTELVGGSTVVVNDNEPGQDGTDSILVTGQVVGTWGVEDVRVEAQVLPTADNLVRLMAEGEHAYDCTGIDINNDTWTTADSDILARASLVDELTVSGVSTPTATVELYFQIRGMADALIDIDPGGDISYTMATQVRLDVATALPHTGGGTHATSIVWPGGYRVADLDEQKFLDEYVMLSLEVDPTEPIPLDIAFEITPATTIRHRVEIGSLDMTGLHRPSFWDAGAELLGVVVKDDTGTVVPNALIAAGSGYDFPVVEDPPPPHPPANVILSPVAIIDSDLGEYNATVPYEHMIDQSGLSVNFTSGQTGFDTHFSLPNALRTSGSYVNNWQSVLDTTLPMQGYIDFDLGSTQSIDRVAIWNVTLEDVTFLIADDPAGPWTPIGSFTLPSHYSWFSYDANILDLGGSHTGRYLRLQVDSAYLTSTSSTYGIVGELAVRALPVPEPGALMMLGSGGLALAALGARRRRTAGVGAGH